MDRPHEAARLLLRTRSAAGLSQAELARRAGIPHSVLSAYEHGRRDPGTGMLARLLGAAGFRLTVSRSGPDVDRCGRDLKQVLDLADRFPKRRRGDLKFPGLPR
jgi:transcriptional regulator with XRE-family HTH domain